MPTVLLFRADIILSAGQEGRKNHPAWPGRQYSVRPLSVSCSFSNNNLPVTERQGEGKGEKKQIEQHTSPMGRMPWSVARLGAVFEQYIEEQRSRREREKGMHFRARFVGASTAMAAVPTHSPRKIPAQWKMMVHRHLCAEMERLDATSFWRCAKEIVEREKKGEKGKKLACAAAARKRISFLLKHSEVCGRLRQEHQSSTHSSTPTSGAQTLVGGKKKREKKEKKR